MRSPETGEEGPGEFEGHIVEGFASGKKSLPSIEINGRKYLFGNDLGKQGTAGYTRVYSRLIEADNITKIEYLILDVRGKVVKQFVNNLGSTRFPDRPAAGVSYQ